MILFHTIDKYTLHRRAHLIFVQFFQRIRKNHLTELIDTYEYVGIALVRSSGYVLLQMEYIAFPIFERFVHRLHIEIDEFSSLMNLMGGLI